MAHDNRASRGVLVALAVVAAAYAVNAGFNHTAWGLTLKAQGALYVFAFFLVCGVALPAEYIGWLVAHRAASARWLGARVGVRDVVAAGIGLAVGGVLAAGALAPHVREPQFLSTAHRLFALLLVASTAEVLLFLGVLGNAVQRTMDPRRRWAAGLVTLIVSSLAFGFFHLTYPAPWNTLDRALGLSLVWVPVSLLFLASRSLVAAVLLNNVLALIGFAKNGLDLPGTAATGWWHAALACAVFVAVFRLTTRVGGRGRPVIGSDAGGRQ